MTRRRALTFVLTLALAAAIQLLPAGMPVVVVGLVGVLALQVAAVIAPTVLLAIGAALMANDRYGTATVGDALVRPTHLLVLFAALGAALALPDLKQRRNRRSLPRWVLVAGTALVVIALARGARFAASGESLRSVAGAVGIPLVGGLLPCIAAVLCLREASWRRVVLVVLGFHAAIAAISAVAIPYSGLNQFVEVTDITGRERVRGLALEPGFYAVACVALMPACAALAVDRTAPRWRFVPVLAVFAALLAGGARGGLVLAVPAALIGIGLGRPEILRMRPRRAFALGAAIAAFCVLAVVAIPSLHAEVSRLTAGNSDVSNSQRVRLYQTVARVVRDHPIIGVGDIGDPELLKRYGFGEFFVGGEGTALNVVLQTVGETGALGGAVLLAMLAGLGLALRMKTDDSADARLARALVAGGLLTLVLYGLGLSLNWDLRVWVPIALGIAGLLLHPGPADQTVELRDAAVSA